MGERKISRPKKEAVAAVEDFPLRLEWRTPAELADNPANWRKHPESQTAPLASVIRKVGWAGAMLYNETTRRLIDGHARKGLPADTLVNGKLPVLVGKWSEEQERMILATLDPLAAMAEVDQDALGKLLMQTQTDDEALAAMLKGLAEENEIDLFAAAGESSDGDSEPQIDRAAELQKEWGTELGQLWTIPGKAGVHRVLCGDSTKREDVERLMGGKRADMLLTDPPYNLGESWNGLQELRGNKQVANDAQAGDWFAWAENAFAVWEQAALGSDVACYWWHALRANPRDMLERKGYTVHAVIIWVKEHFNVGRADLHSQYEPCLYFSRGDRHFCGRRDMSDVWDARRVEQVREHPTQKHVPTLTRPPGARNWAGCKTTCGPRSPGRNASRPPGRPRKAIPSG